MTKLRGKQQLESLRRRYRVGRKRKQRTNWDKPKMTAVLNVPSAQVNALVERHRSRSIWKRLNSRQKWSFVCSARKITRRNTERVVISTYLVGRFLDMAVWTIMDSMTFTNLGTFQRYNLIKDSFDLTKKETLYVMTEALSLHKEQGYELPYEACLRHKLAAMVSLIEHIVKIPIVQNRCTYLSKETLDAICEQYPTQHDVPTWAQIMKLARQYGSESVSIVSL